MERERIEVREGYNRREKLVWALGCSIFFLLAGLDKMSF